MREANAAAARFYFHGPGHIHHTNSSAGRLGVHRTVHFTKIDLAAAGEVGGALQRELFDEDDQTMVMRVRHELRELLGVTAAPLLSRVSRHRQAMPQYRVGHLDRIARIDAHLAPLTGLALAGNAYRGVGIPDCIRSGELAAEAVMNQLAAPTRRVGL